LEASAGALQNEKRTRVAATTLQIFTGTGRSSDDRWTQVEAANNAILHAYREDPGKTVDVEVALYAEKIVFDVIDTGTSADPARMNADHRAARLPAISSGNLKESGRGVAIMQEVMDSVEYTTGSGSNRLRLIKKLKRKD
jgi:anti-sigma regulatory factor (Ser/Thr protein kinase)